MNKKFNLSDLKDMDIEEYLDNFLVKVEKKINLDHCSNEFLCLWARLRQIVSDSVVSAITLQQDNTLQDLQDFKLEAPSKKKRLIFGISIFKSLIFKNPFFTTRKKKIVIFTNSRRVINHNTGLYEDLYSEPLYDYFKKDHTYLIEEPWYNIHRDPIAYNTKHGDVIVFLSYLLGLLSFRPLKKETLSKIKLIENEISYVFGLNIDIKTFAKKTWLKRKGSLLAYKLLFLWLNPRLIFYISLNTDTALIEAARKLGIKTCELQHGILGRNVTSVSRSAQKVAPDYLLTFGDFWSKENDNFKPHRFVIGFEYLNKKRKEYPLNKKKQILMISDGSLSMASLAVQLSKQYDNYNIIFKLKPSEFFDCKKKYSILYENSTSVLVIDSNKQSNYELLSRSEYQIGGCSMLLFEGIAFKCRTIIIRGPGYSYLEGLVKKGYAIFGSYCGNFDLNSAPQIDAEKIDHLFNLNSPFLLKKFLEEVLH